ncbi:very short patch repair endonuclease [Bacillus sp. H-16]|uniref:very short patch repair endonuclease n=1 Tax=Alteribacter salitolerans TaxID=2912333 RepID=UPI0019669214|nr:very short patch repair endonuclease [Alteribacter salitolerans]MBM7096230.1 very short patch repair endonuclease [Alteribacter salitolerans]
MTDTLTKDQRRKNMKAIKSPSKLENAVSKELWNKGIRFRKNSRGLFGKPDISIRKYKIVIFIDSCFWHCCTEHGNMPKTNKDFWEQKLKRNVERDKEVTSYYKARGWNIMRVWEHEIKNDFDDAIKRIHQFILSSQGAAG